MPSPASKQAEALADVERIAQALYETQREHSIGWLPWRTMDKHVHETYRKVVRDLLHRDVIRVGTRPDGGERPMDGQLEISDA